MDLIYNISKISDAYPVLDLKAMLVILFETYLMIPLDERVYKLPIRNFRFKIEQFSHFFSFFYDSKRDMSGSDSGVNGNDDNINDLEKEAEEIRKFNEKVDATPDEIAEFISYCFRDYLFCFIEKTC